MSITFYPGSTTLLDPWVSTLFSILPLVVAGINIIYLILRLITRPSAWTTAPFPEPIKDDFEDTTPKTKLSYPSASLCLLTFAGFIVQLYLTFWLHGSLLPTLAWGFALIYLVIERPRTAPILMVLFFAIMFTAQAVEITSRVDKDLSHPANVVSIVNAVLAFLAGVVAVNMPLRDPFKSSEDIGNASTVPTSKMRSPEDDMTLWQWMSLSWMSSTIKVGYTRQLDDPDIWSLPYTFQHRYLHYSFRELRGSVMRRLLKANWLDLVVLAFLALVELVANFSQPLLLQQLLLAMQIVHINVQPAIVFGVLNLVASLIATQSTIFSLWFGRSVYERSRGEMIMMLYEKTLKRKIVSGVNNEEIKPEGIADAGASEAIEEDANNSEAAPATEVTPLLNGNGKMAAKIKVLTATSSEKKQSFLGRLLFRAKPKDEPKMPATTGKIINMFRNDAYEVAQRFWDAQQLIKKPLGLIIALVLSWRLVGWSILLGVVIVLIAQFLNVVLAKLMVSWEKTRRKVTDDRLQRTSQFVEALRHLRWYGWQTSWLGGIMESRQRELKIKVITSFLRMGINMTSILASGLLPVASFYAYTELEHKELSVDIAFPALALFDLLQRELRDLPTYITTWLNAMVAVSRLEDFMAEPDRTEEEDTSFVKDDSLELRKATFAWPGASRNVLSDISIKFVPGLNVLFGEVAAGKTALLQALLGELNLVSGEVCKPDKPFGYCAQTPWLQSMSIRDNILFAAPYDHARYRETIEVCALLPDFSNFKDGDLSEIGENGIGLSGGQKARVALARAVYSRTDVVLLDDPLSALDQQTAEWVASRCLGGELMRGRTMILVTHRTDLCKGLAKQMIEISHGKARVSDEELTLTSVRSREVQSGDVGKEEEKEQEPATKFLDEETRAVGGIEWTVYWQFIKAGGAWTWIVLLIVDVVFHSLVFVRNWFLKEWGEAYSAPKQINLLFFPTISTADITTLADSTPLSRFFERFPNPADNPTPWLIGLTVIVVVQSAAWWADQLVMVVLIYTTGRRMFQLIMTKVTNAVFRFYDITPVGRLMNRMTSDIGAIDGRISGTLSNVIFWGASWAISVFIIAGTTPAFLVAAALLTAAFVLIFLRFLPTSQSLRRLETVSLSPLMSNFGALLEGLTTVRAYHAQPRFLDGAIDSTDTFQKMDHFYWSLQGWLTYRTEILSSASTFGMTLLAIFTGVSPGLTAFVLRAAGKLVQTTQAMCNEYGKLQMDFVSVERVVELFHIEQEPVGDVDPPASWPSYTSDIVFEDVTIRYAPHLDPALSNISFNLPGGSNTAVIGRTGSGKSTLALALLGTIVPESGRILIGGIDVAKVNKQALRSRVSFLAQDPVLFPGSMRKNLDPTNQHTDAECANVLARVCGRFNWTLAMEIDTGGKNLSQGQRQLVGLCRAILRRSAVIIMDEATASIDKDSAWEIQRVLREELRESTVVTIAHRSEAVRGAEWCLNLGKGRILSYGRVSEEGGAASQM